MPPFTPCHVLAIDEFGCAYEWDEFWTTDRADVLDTLAVDLGLDNLVYLRVVET
jgi:hypothetical protein